ncbi:MAG TPA: MoaD/ThiS family protein [Kofleriaceae bacterium]|nr:MoaD/ThiS family protein [Kofleriaceae bacterium]
MAHATLELPTLLQRVLGGRATLEVEGENVLEALEDAYRQVPALRVHLCDESGALRRHVLCFHNDINTRWVDESPRLSDGDCITIMQAVSGG